MSGPGLRHDLAQSLKNHSALPYLFIGSGLSRRYLGLPDWAGLLRYFSDLIGEDYDFHNADADGSPPRVASSLAQAFHPVWWKDERFEKQREVHKSGAASREAAFKIAVASHIKANSELRGGSPGVDNETYAAELDCLKRATIDGIITTNYDSLTDQVFPDFKAYVGQDELLLSDAQFIAETYKIHGSQDQPDSLVLTENDYKEFAKRNHYLAAKLLTIFAEHPVVFLGYSLGDDYIREIIENIAAAVGPKRVDELGQRIYFVEWNEDPTSPSSLLPSSIGLTEGSTLPIQRIGTHGFLPVFEALASLDRPFPAKVLRELRKHVFDLVTDPDPEQSRETVRAVPLDSDGASDLRVVFGVGSFSEKDLEDLSSISGRALTRDDLARDLLGVRARGFEASNVLSHGLSQLLRSSGNAYVPVYKYLYESGRISDGSVDLQALPAEVIAAAKRTPVVVNSNKARFKRDLAGKVKTPRDVMATDYPLYFKFDSLLCLDTDDFNPEELRAVLAAELDDTDAQTQGNRSYLYKAISYYDRLRYGPKPEPTL
ncbi:SIR2 family protein [Arthrobacter crystallopoietes]|uniref:SIR2 family protein n=1 Tax=Crystallibacter crystallopoietes TaxID=37928 RepID=UPI00148750BB|nr:SIR2 family protein [Arthrobacter crystallopoietes]